MEGTLELTYDERYDHTIARLAKKVAELQETAKEESIELPYPPEFIVMLEEYGFVVDLQTGQVIPEEGKHERG